jgi:hypothetical protein
MTTEEILIRGFKAVIDELQGIRGALNNMSGDLGIMSPAVRNMAEKADKAESGISVSNMLSEMSGADLKAIRDAVTITEVAVLELKQKLTGDGQHDELG